MTTDSSFHLSHPETGRLSRRKLLTLWSAGCVLSLSGCGSGDEDVAGSGPSTPAGSIVPPNLSTTSEAGPAAATDDYDRGVSTSAMVTAAQGGAMALPDGATLIIPPGALAADTRITVNMPTKAPPAGQLPTDDAPVILKYVFSPAGTRFSKPVILRRPLPTLSVPMQVQVWASSGLNPVLDAGSEQTNWQQCLAPNSLPASLDIQLDHFTFVFAGLATTDSAYLVLDIAPKHLEVGDLLFTLTAVNGPHQWRPGHVGMLVKSQPPFSSDSDETLVETGGVAVAKNTLVAVKPGDQNFKFGENHIYLGPRRALNADGEGLTDAQKDGVAKFLYQQLGKKYSLIGDTLTADLVGLYTGDLLGGGDTYSCVSLVEAALRSVDRQLLDLYTHALFSTPYDEFFASKPIPSITVQVGEAVELPVYAVQLTPDSIFGLALAYGAYSRERPYSVYAEGLPPGARFDSVDLQADAGGGTAPGYKMTWTPQPSDAGQTYKTRFHFTGDPLLLGLGPGINRFLSFKVVGNRYTPTLIPLDGYQYQSVKSINRHGAVLYGVSNYSTGVGYFDVHIFKDGTDRTVLKLPLSPDAPYAPVYLSNLNDDEHFAYAFAPVDRTPSSRAYLYRDGVSVDLGIEPTLSIQPLAINNNDDVVAIATDVAASNATYSLFRTVVSKDTPTGRKAALLSDDLPEINAVNKCIINQSGQVAFDASQYYDSVHTGSPANYTDQMVWLVENGKAELIYRITLGIPTFGDRVGQKLVDFNDAGVVLLQAEDNRAQQADPAAPAIAVGLTWQAGVYKQLPSYNYSTQFGSYTASGGQAITDAGQVIGSVVYNADNTSAQFVEDLIDYTSDVPKGIPIPILSGRAQLSFVCANKVGQIVITLDIPQAGVPDRKTILALLTPA